MGSKLMKVSVGVTVYNEEKSISELIVSLLKQSKLPDEIVIVDGVSKDKTVEIIRHWQKKDRRIKLLVQKCTPAEGRNLAVELAINDIIAMTDAGCIAGSDWLKNLIEPFKTREVDIVAGFYTMTAQTSLQKAFTVFLGVHPNDFDMSFLPSGRSIAFRREAWERIGGFPESLDDTAEDTIFNYKAVKEGLKIARVKNARVEWSEIPNSLSEGIKKIYYYAKGDAKSGIWLHPAKGLSSHNIKALFIFLRYLIGLILLYYSFFSPLILLVLLVLLILYIFRSFRKVYIRTGNLQASLLGIFIQFASDIAVMVGFLFGLIKV